MAKKRCYGCMKLKSQTPVCEHCGFNEYAQNESHQLPFGTVLNNQYMVGKCLGQGGFGITYLGWDQFLDTPVAIKEYYPNGFVARDCRLSLEVTICENKAGALFQSSRERFMREAQTLAKLSNVPGVVHVRNFFQQNNTAYIVMEYVKGIDLRRYMNMHGGRLGIQETLRILRPIMDAMITVHQAGIVHRDISPDNIMILPDGSVKLLDFGAVRNVESEDADQDLPKSTEAILKHGFAPIEQYQRRGALGPWTDVYALCANVFYCATGKIPPDAPDRMMEDTPINWPMIPGLTPRQRAALEKGTAIRAKERYATVDQLVADLYAEDASSSGQPQPAVQQVIRPSQYVSQQVPKQSQYASQQVPKQSQYASQQIPKQSQYGSQQIHKQSQFGSQQPGQSQYGQQGYPQYAPQGQPYQQPGQGYPYYGPQGQQPQGYPYYGPQSQGYPQYGPQGQPYPYYGPQGQQYQPGQPYQQPGQGYPYYGPQGQQPQGYPYYGPQGGYQYGPQGQQYGQYPPQPGYPQYGPQGQPYQQPQYVPQEPAPVQAAADLGKTVPVELMDEESEAAPIPAAPEAPLADTPPEEPAIVQLPEEPAAQEPEEPAEPEMVPVIAAQSLAFGGFDDFEDDDEIIEEVPEEEPITEEPVEEPIPEEIGEEIIEEVPEVEPIIDEPAPEEEHAAEEQVEEPVSEVVEEEIPEEDPVVEEFPAVIPMAMDRLDFQAEDFGATVAVIPEPVEEPIIEEPIEEPIPEVIEEEVIGEVPEEEPIIVEPVEETIPEEIEEEIVEEVPEVEPIIEEPIEEPIPEEIEEEVIEEALEEEPIIEEPVEEPIPEEIEEEVIEEVPEEEPVIEEPIEEPIPEEIEEEVIEEVPEVEPIIEEPIEEPILEEIEEEIIEEVPEAEPIIEEPIEEPIPEEIEEEIIEEAPEVEPIIEEPVEEPVPEVIEEEIIEEISEEEPIIEEPVEEPAPEEIEEEEIEEVPEEEPVTEEPIEEPAPEEIEEEEIEEVPEEEPVIEEPIEEPIPEEIEEEVIEEVPEAEPIVEEPEFQAEDFGPTVAVLPEPEPQAEEIGPTVAAPVEEPASEPEPQPEPEPEEEIVEDEPMAEEPGQKTAGGQGKTKNKLLIPIIAGVAAVAAVAALVLFGGKKADTPAETEKAHISQNQQVEDLDYNLQREPVIYANSTVVQEFQDYSYLEITTDENGNEISRLYYDGDRNLIRRDEASYDAEGRMVSMAGYDEGDNLRISREWEYNAAGKVAKLTTRLDGKDFSTVVPEYDSHGEKIHWVETAADGTVLGEITYEYEYDAKGTKLSSRQTYFDGSTWDITYDIRGNAVTEIYRNWAGEETRYERVFNEYGEVIENTAYDADGNMTFRSEYSWDNRGRNTKCVTYTPDGEVDYRNGYVYDAHGNEYAGSYEAQGFHETWQTVYDIAGYPIRSFSTYRQSNYQSEGIDYYDYLGNVETSESYSEGALNYKAEYQYDAYGRELGHTGTSYNPYDGTYTVYVYDADGNETETKMYDGNGAVIANIEREYDENGHETRYVERRPDGTIAYEYTSRYSADGIEEYFMSIQYTDTGAVEYRSETWYDSQGREIKNIYENQDGYYHCYETQYDGNVTTKTGYDRDGNVEYRSETWYDSQGREIKNIYENQDGYYHCYETQYDGNVTTKTGYDRDGNVESLRVTTYDSTGRAMSETYEDYDDDYRYHYEYQYQGDVTITISYDENGNEEYRSSEQHTENGLILKYYYDDANRMKRFYVYDRNWEDLLHIYADAETMAGYQPILNAILKMDADMVKTMADDLEALTWYASEFTAEEMEVLLAEIMASYGYDYVRFFGYDPFAKLEESAGAQPEETQPTTPAEPTGSLMQAFPLSDGDGDGSSAPAFGLSIQREDVTALFFTGSDVNPMDLFAGMHGNVEGMTMNSQDISEALDGSVMAHEMGGVIVICGNGGVAAPENCDYLFSGFRSLETVDFGAFHTAGVKSMHAMFAYCKSLVDLDLSGFNTSQVTDMSCMFYRCNRLKSVNVSSFDTSRVADMNAMFATGQDFALGGGSLSALERLDLSNFNTANVTNMSNMFHNCDSLRILNVSSFDTAKVTDMSYMFNGCKKLSSLDLSSFNTSRVTNMSYMLFDCTWTNVDHFDFSKVTQYENFMNYNYEQYFE